MRVSLSSSGRPACSGGVAGERRIRFREIAGAAVTLATLSLSHVWVCLLAGRTAGMLFLQGAPSFRQFLALSADTALLTALFLAAWRVAQPLRRFRGGERFTNWTFLLFLIVPANAACNVLERVSDKLSLESWTLASGHVLPRALRWVPSIAPGDWILGLLAMVLTAGCLFHRSAVRLGCRILLLLFPVVPFMFAEACWVAWPRAADEKPVAYGGRIGPVRQIGGAADRQRVVWVIFDEMDYRLAFETATNLHLPEFNRLARTSLFADHAYPPGGRTMISVPALLAGRLVKGSTPAGTSELRIRYEGSPAGVRWAADQTLIGAEQRRGRRTAIVGWYFPYARIFGRDVDAWQDQGWRLGLNPQRPFGSLMADELRIVAERRTETLLGVSPRVMEHRRLVRELMVESMGRAADRDLDLVFLHLPVPHFPFFYNAETGEESGRPRPAAAYLDHLQLADRVLGQIRRAIADAGLEGRTILLVSSDHWNRDGEAIDGRMDHRVPFLLHFPGAVRGVRYSARFNTVLSRGLISGALAGQIRSAEEAARRIDEAKGGLSESPYNDR